MLISINLFSDPGHTGYSWQEIPLRLSEIAITLVAFGYLCDTGSIFDSGLDFILVFCIYFNVL
jgi:hypothetical protein